MLGSHVLLPRQTYQQTPILAGVRMTLNEADQAKHGDRCSANQVNPDPMCLPSFGDGSTGPLALPCSRNEALVDKGAAAPKS